MKTNKIFTVFLIVAILAMVGMVSATISTPTIPSGPAIGSPNTSYGYYTKATDDTNLRLKYTYDWGDGSISTSPLVSSGVNVKMYHKWTTAGSYSIRTKATNSAGLVSAWSPIFTLQINSSTLPTNNPPGTPSVPSGSKSGSSGTSYSYSTKGTDPDGDFVMYTFDWGDGTTSTTSLVASGTTASASHSWTVAAGSTKTFSVRAMATDESGKSSGWSSALSVTINGPVVSSSNPPAKPSMPWGALTGYTIYSYTYETKTTDPDGDQVKFIFNWGDGTTTTTEYVDSGALARASHQWKGKETGGCQGFNITVKAIDVHGMESVWSNALPISMVTNPVNHPPTIPTVTGPTNGVSGVPLKFSVVSSDPDGHKIKYTIHWGDTIEETGYIPSGQAATVSHVWNVPAGTTRTYSIIALAVDQYGMMCPSPRWSTPLVVSITGPVVRGLVLGLESEENETAYLDTDKANSIDEQTNESDFVDEQTNESEFTDYENISS